MFKFELKKLYVLLSIVFVLCSVCSSGQSGDDVGPAFVVWLHMVWSICRVIVSEDLCLFIICNIIVGKYYVGKNMIVIINF